MIDIGSHTGHKLGILLILTTLIIGNVAALQWSSPEDNGVVQDQPDLEVLDGSGSIDFYYSEDEDDWNTIATDAGAEGSANITWEDTPTSGEYSLRAEDDNENSTITVSLDKSSPDISSESPGDGGLVSNDNPDIEASFDDSIAGLASAWINFDASGDDVNESQNFSGETDSQSLEIDFSDHDFDDLEEGEEYTVDYGAYDEAGNQLDGSWTFTVDTSYDGDSNPSFSVEDESGGVVLFNDDKDLDVDFGDADSTSDTDVTCVVGGEDVDSFTVDAGDDDQEFTCEIDHNDNEDYYDSSAEIYLEMEDQAGNTAESDSETVSFDVNPPSVTGLDIPINANLYNSDFDVEFTAFDSASDIEEVKYYFSDDTAYNNGNDIDYSSGTDSYEIDTSSLDAGDHTLYVRAKDEAGRWSSARTVDFSFDPEAVPEISLAVPQNMSITAGEQAGFDVTVENTGDIHVSSIELSGSAGEFFEDSESISDLEPGNSVTSTMDVDTGSNDLGEHTIEVSTDRPAMTEEIDLIVTANEEQQSRIDSDLSEYQGMLQEMEANVTSLKQKVSEDKKQRLDSNFSEFKQKVEDAQSAVENGDYYEAEAILEGIDQDRSAAESSYEAVKKEYENNRFWMLIFLGLGGIVVLGGGAIGALTYTDEVGFDIRDYLESLQETDIDVDTSALGNFTDKIKKMMEGKDTSEAEEFEWNGFNSK